MTTIRQYQCNLCRSTVRDGNGRGFRFGHGRLDWTTLSDAENHLCDHCVKCLVVSIQDKGIQESIEAN